MTLGKLLWGLSNIEYNKHYDLVFAFIEKEKPDVICFQEVLEEDFVFLEKKLGMKGYFKTHKYMVSMSSSYVELEGKREGIVIFSNNIIATEYSFYWGSEENLEVSLKEYISDENKQVNHLLIWVDIKDEQGEIYRYVTTHFPVTIEGESSPHQLEILDPFFEKLDSLGEFILAGDFNAPRGNQTFTHLADKYKDSIPLHYKTSIDQNIHRKKGIQFMVDGLFTTPAYRATDVALVDGLSDHMAILATISKTTSP